MDRLIWKGPIGLAAFALLAAQPAQAATTCWGPEQAAAAKVRDLQSRLMVATLRCHAMGVDKTADYNDFVRQNRDTLQAANGVLKAQFEQGFGKEGQTEYDRFATSLANAYGGDATSADICDATAASEQEAAQASGDVGKLIAIADRFGSAPALPGGECPITFSQR